MTWLVSSCVSQVQIWPVRNVFPSPYLLQVTGKHPLLNQNNKAVGGGESSWCVHQQNGPAIRLLSVVPTTEILKTFSKISLRYYTSEHVVLFFIMSTVELVKKKCSRLYGCEVVVVPGYLRMFCLKKKKDNKHRICGWYELHCKTYRV